MTPESRPVSQFAVFSTALGWMGVAWSGSRVVATTFGNKSPRAAQVALRRTLAPHVGCQAAEAAGLANGLLDGDLELPQVELMERLKAFADGQPDPFLDLDLALEHLTEFQRQVVDACRRIAYGRTLSYAALARSAGSPRAARAVGNVMRNNRFPLIVPCHRVVGSGGSLGGYSAPEGLAMKQRLLRMEAHGASAIA